MNLGASGGLILSERLAAALTPSLGKKAAKAAIAQAAAESIAVGQPLATVLARSPELSGVLDQNRLSALVDPHTYIGAAESLVARALTRYRAGGETAIERAVERPSGVGS